MECNRKISVHITRETSPLFCFNFRRVSNVCPQVYMIFWVEVKVSFIDVATCCAHVHHLLNVEQAGPQRILDVK